MIWRIVKNTNRDSVKYNHLAVPVWDIYSYDNLQRLTRLVLDRGFGRKKPQWQPLSNRQFRQKRPIWISYRIYPLISSWFFTKIPARMPGVLPAYFSGDKAYFPAARLAEATVLNRSIVIVIGPTPPGTGVIRLAFSDTAAKSTSPTRR